MAVGERLESFAPSAPNNERKNGKTVLQGRHSKECRPIFFDRILTAGKILVAQKRKNNDKKQKNI